MDQLEGWKIMIVPTAVEPCVGPSGTRTGSRSRATSVIGLAREGRTQYRHLDCKACRLYTLHKVEQIPQSNGKLMLFDVQLHPRTAFTRDFTIPLSFTAASDHTTFTLVGFLIQDVQSQGVAAGNGFSRVSYSDGSFWEHVGQHKVGYTIGADPKRTPCLVLYQRASLVRKPTLCAFRLGVYLGRALLTDASTTSALSHTHQVPYQTPSLDH
jgi:hypothetical protein